MCKATERNFFTDSQSFCWEFGLIDEQNLLDRNESNRFHDIHRDSNNYIHDIHIEGFTYHYASGEQCNDQNYGGDQECENTRLRKLLAGQESDIVIPPSVFLQVITSELKDIYKKLFDLQNLKCRRDEGGLPRREQIEVEDVLPRGFAKLREEANARGEVCKAFAREFGAKSRYRVSELRARRLLDVCILELREITINCDLEIMEASDRADDAGWGLQLSMRSGDGLEPDPGFTKLDEEIERRYDLPESNRKRSFHTYNEGMPEDVSTVCPQQIKRLKPLSATDTAMRSYSLSPRSSSDMEMDWQTTLKSSHQFEQSFRGTCNINSLVESIYRLRIY